MFCFFDTALRSFAHAFFYQVEAAAVTAGIAGSSFPVDTPLEVMADLPFQFFIIDSKDDSNNTAIVLFEGRVFDPTPQNTTAAFTAKHTDADFWLANFGFNATRVFNDTPVAAPVIAPAAPIAAPVAAPNTTPVTAPVAAPTTTSQAPVMASPGAAPVMAPGGPVAAPTTTPVTAPVAAPTTKTRAPVMASPVAAPVSAVSASTIANMTLSSALLLAVLTWIL
jgi:hypothetical protein